MHILRFNTLRLGSGRGCGFHSVRIKSSPCNVHHPCAGGRLWRHLSFVTLDIDCQYDGVLSRFVSVTLRSKSLWWRDLFPGRGEYQSIWSSTDGERHLWPWRVSVRVQTVTSPLESTIPGSLVVCASWCQIVFVLVVSSGWFLVDIVHSEGLNWQRIARRIQKGKLFWLRFILKLLSARRCWVPMQFSSCSG